MVNKVEFAAISLSVLALAAAIMVVRFDSFSINRLAATIPTESQAALTVVSQEGDQEQARARALADSIDTNGQLRKLVVDDIVLGAGPIVERGDSVTVHYTGRLETGQEFDNSRRNGEPFTFTVGAGRVIAGWEQGIIGMQPGGQRVLVVPPELGYGADGFGPIPGNATLIFAVELIAINE